MKAAHLVGAAALVAVAGAAAYFVLNRSDPGEGTAPALAGAPASAPVLERGEYLAHAADCIACHTVPETGKAYAGGLAFKLPFGTLYSTNITADPETGIGRWSDEQFVRAVRDGVRADGKHLYPAFPYTAYTQLSRADVLAIKTYLFSLPPVKQAATPNALPFPFNQRWAMSFWNAVFFKSERFTADASKPPEWNQGAYLANALGHCGECHTPRNLGFGLKRGSEFAGAELQGWKAYNLTADKAFGLGAWTDEQLADYLHSGHAEGRASAAGPMGEVVSYSLQHLKPEDIAALVTYLRAVPAKQGEHQIVIDEKPPLPAASSDAAPGAGDLQVANDPGFALFAGACASCHRWDGSGQPRHAALLSLRSVNDPAGSNAAQIILHGSAFEIAGEKVDMPSFGAGYSDTEIATLTNFVIRHFGNKTGTVTPHDVAQRRSP